MTHSLSKKHFYSIFPALRKKFGDIRNGTNRASYCMRGGPKDPQRTLREIAARVRRADHRQISRPAEISLMPICTSTGSAVNARIQHAHKTVLFSHRFQQLPQLRLARKFPGRRQFAPFPTTFANRTILERSRIAKRERALDNPS